MKNIFKLMGIALLASSMILVSCKKDEENNGNNGNGGNNDNTPTAKVTFGSSTWDAAVAHIWTSNYGQENYSIIECALYKTEGNYPFVGFLITANPGTYTNEASLQQGNGYTYYAWQGSYDIYSLDFCENEMMNSNNHYGDWRPVSVNLTMTSFDINTLKATYTINATLFDYAAWYNDIVTNAEDADTKALTVTVNDYTFTAGPTE